MPPLGGFWFVHGSPRKSVGMSRSPSLPLSPSGFFALIAPDGDILPVRTCYGDSGETNIGLNPLTSKESIWYAGPDLATAVLLKTGRPPTIIKAIKLVPVGTQDGLVPTMLGASNHRSLNR